VVNTVSVPSRYDVADLRPLPDDLVEFIDDLVRNNDATSRAAVVAGALERDRRRRIAARDAAILAAAGADSDLDAVARHAAATVLEDLD
jgi:Arc/MetJ-type ribon-helix-helix transcriptional regulator